MQNQADQKLLQEQLAELKNQESELMAELEVYEQTHNCNQVQLSRLKKQLSTLQEQIQQLKSSLIPDQPA